MKLSLEQPLNSAMKKRFGLAPVRLLMVCSMVVFDEWQGARSIGTGEKLREKFVETYLGLKRKNTYCIQLLYRQY